MGVVELVPGLVAEPEAVAADRDEADLMERAVRDGEDRRALRARRCPPRGASRRACSGAARRSCRRTTPRRRSGRRSRRCSGGPSRRVDLTAPARREPTCRLPQAPEAAGSPAARLAAVRRRSRADASGSRSPDSATAVAAAHADDDLAPAGEAAVRRAEHDAQDRQPSPGQPEDAPRREPVSWPSTWSVPQSASATRRRATSRRPARGRAAPEQRTSRRRAPAELVLRAGARRGGHLGRRDLAAEQRQGDRLGGRLSGCRRSRLRRGARA